MAKFEKGRPKSGGRKKGSKDIKTLLRAKAILSNLGINPVEEMLKVIPTMKPDSQFEAWKFLQSYCEVPLKENTPEDQNQPEETASTEDLISLVK